MAMRTLPYLAINLEGTVVAHHYPTTLPIGSGFLALNFYPSTCVPSSSRCISTRRNEVPASFFRPLQSYSQHPDCPKCR